MQSNILFAGCGMMGVKEKIQPLKKLTVYQGRENVQTENNDKQHYKQTLKEGQLQSLDIALWTQWREQSSMTGKASKGFKISTTYQTCTVYSLSEAGLSWIFKVG